MSNDKHSDPHDPPAPVEEAIAATHRKLDVEFAPERPARTRARASWLKGPLRVLTLLGAVVGANYATAHGYLPDLVALLMPPAKPVAPVAKAAPKPPSVTVAKAGSTQLVDQSIVSGTLVAREEVMVAPELDGLRIVEVLVDEGSRVEAGQVLARLSRSTLEVERARLEAQVERWNAAMKQAKAGIAEASASKKEMAKALQRAKILKRSATVSEAAVENKEQLAESAAARMQSAQEALGVASADKAVIEQQLKDLEIRLGRTEIKAPKAGVIARKQARVGSVAGMGGGALFTIIADASIELEAEVPEARLAKLAAGQRVEVTPTGFDAPVEGTVRLVLPEIDRASRLGKVRVALPVDERLRLGAFARAVIEAGRWDGLTVPVSALSYDGGSTFVQVVTAGKVRARLVKVGLIARGRAEIMKGLDAGEDVVERAGSFLRDGDVVTPVLAATDGSVELTSAK